MRLATLDALLVIVSGWASQKSLIKRVHLFGSRVRGDNGADSDLDVAVELDPNEFEACDESGGIATWMFETGAWKAELQSLTGIEVQLQHFTNETLDPTIARGLHESSVIAYEKPS